MNKYEKALLVNLKIMKILFACAVLANLFLPLYRPLKFGFSTFSCYVFIFIHIFALRNGLGYGKQTVPLMPIVLLRCIHVLLNIFLFKSNILPATYSILVILELSFMIFLLLDRSQFTYERSPE